MDGDLRSRRGCAARRSAFVLCVLLVAGDAGRLSAQGPGSIFGRVSDRSGLPVAGAAVRIEAAGLESTADADGRFRIQGIRAGRLRLVVTAPGYRAGSEDVLLPRDGESVRHDVTLLEEPVRLPAVEIRVDRPLPAAGWTLTREDLDRAGSLARALSRVPGVFVREYGAGGPQEVSIRGAAPDQTLVLWGREPILAPAGGAVDLRTLPAAAVDSVEVIPSGASARYGAGALGGVVRLYPAAPDSRPGPWIVAEGDAGSLGTAGIATTLSVPAGRAAVRLDAGARRFAEDFSGRPNAGGEEETAALSARAGATGVSLEAMGLHSSRGAPGPAYDPTPRARIRSRRWLAAATLEREVAGTSLRAETAVQAGRVAYRDADRPALETESRETALSLRVGASREIGRHRVEGGLEARRDGIEGTDLAGKPRRDELGLYASARLGGVALGRLVLSPSARLDRIAVAAGAGDFGDGPDESRIPAREDVFVSPSLSAAFGLGRGLVLRLQGGRSFRYPEFQSLFFVPGVGVRGNPGLREERSQDLELGAEWSPSPGIRAGAAVFDRRIEGAVVWLPDFRFVWSPRNLPRARARGLDLSASWRGGGGWEVGVTYSYAPARFDFPGNRNPLPYRPAQLGRVEVAYATGRWSSALETRLVGRRYPNLAGTNAIPAYALADWSLEWSQSLGGSPAALRLRLENLLDSAYDVVFGFPGAGRSVEVSLRYGAP